MSEKLINPSSPEDQVNQEPKEAENETNQEDGGNNTPNNSQSQELTIESVQALIAEAIAAFKSELVMSNSQDEPVDSINENKQENKEEKSL